MGPASVPWESPSQDWLPFYPLLDNVLNHKKTRALFLMFRKGGGLGSTDGSPVERALASGWCPPCCSLSHIHSSSTQGVGPLGSQGLSREWQGGGGLLMDFLRVVAGEGKEGVAIHVRGEEWVGLGLTGVSGNRHMGRDDTCPESFWANGPVQLLLQV